MNTHNTGGIKRGDRADTGDNEARPTEGADRHGSGVRAGDDGPAGMPTAEPDTGDGGISDLTILPASDLTDRSSTLKPRK